MTENTCSFDSKFCGGTAAAPEPNSYMDGIGWCLRNTDNGDHRCLTVQAWITSITGGSSPDELTKLDRLIDSSIGGLGTKLENIVSTTRAVPLFEFRNLGGYAAGSFEKKVNDAEQALIAYHLQYKSPPQRKLAKRQIYIDGCSTTSAPSSPTPAPTPSCTLQNEDPDQGIFTQGCICGSTTLPLLNLTSATADAQSCAYTALPTTTEANPITILTSTFTSACQVCTLTGGIADTPTCATITGCQNPSPPPTPAATSTTPPPAPSPSPVCVAGFHGTDNTCGGQCNGPNAKCGCVEAGYELFNLVCTCTC